MLPGGSIIKIDPDQRLWAPNVFFSDGLFYCHYSVSTIGSQNSAIGVATSVTGEPGNWTDHGSIGLPADSRYNRIDANLFRECKTCKPYLNFGSSWEHIFQTTLTNDLLKWSGEAPVHITRNTSYPVKPQTYPSIEEGAFMWWLPNVNGHKYYYLFFSSGACCNTPKSEEGLEASGDEYKIMVCRAESVTGPFIDKNGRNCLTENGGSLVLGSHGEVFAPGGQGLAHDPDVDRVALYYMYGEWTEFAIGSTLANDLQLIRRMEVMKISVSDSTGWISRRDGPRWSSNFKSAALPDIHIKHTALLQIAFSRPIHKSSLMLVTGELLNHHTVDFMA